MAALKPVSPGELLLEEFLVPMQLSQYRLAKEIGVPAQRIGKIVAGKRAITAVSDLRLCRFFGLSNAHWLRACGVRYGGRRQGARAGAASHQAVGRLRRLTAPARPNIARSRQPGIVCSLRSLGWMRLQLTLGVAADKGDDVRCVTAQHFVLLRSQQIYFDSSQQNAA